MATGTMSSHNSWWMLAIRGIIALLFGLAVFIQPNIFTSFVYLFGVYALVDGIVAIGTAFDDRSSASLWWVVLLEGLVGVVIGIISFFLSGALLPLIVIWGILMGILEIVSTFTMNRTFSQEWTMAIGGIVTLILGILFIIFASKGVTSLLNVMGTFAIIFGVMMFARFVQFKSAMDMTSAATA
jgi:uncharacterized membrane protein HdeD (DUF308 family)